MVRELSAVAARMTLGSDRVRCRAPRANRARRLQWHKLGGGAPRTEISTGCQGCRRDRASHRSIALPATSFRSRHARMAGSRVNPAARARARPASSMRPSPAYVKSSSRRTRTAARRSPSIRRRCAVAISQASGLDGTSCAPRRPCHCPRGAGRLFHHRGGITRRSGALGRPDSRGDHWRDRGPARLSRADDDEVSGSTCRRAPSGTPAGISPIMRPAGRRSRCSRD